MQHLDTILWGSLSFGFATGEENYRCLVANVEAWGCYLELLCPLEEWEFSWKHVTLECGLELRPWSTVSPFSGPHPPLTEMSLIPIRLEMVLDRWTSSTTDKPLKCLPGQVVLRWKQDHWPSNLVISSVSKTFWEGSARSTEQMLTHEGIVLHCRGAPGPVLWFSVEAKMKGWECCIPRDYSGEMAICGL